MTTNNELPDFKDEEWNKKREEITKRLVADMNELLDIAGPVGGMKIPLGEARWVQLTFTTDEKVKLH